MQVSRSLIFASVAAGIVCFLVALHNNFTEAEPIFALGAPNHDLYNYYLPLLSFSKQSILSGSFPLWNPYQAGGYPFFATLQCGLLYPVNWVIFLFDVPFAVLVIQALDVSIGMIGMAMYLRYLKLDWPAVVVAAALFGYCVLQQTYTLSVGSTFCWAPIIMWLAHRLHDRPSFGRCAALAAVLTICALAGFPQFFIYICIMVSAYFFVVALMSDGVEGYRAVIRKNGMLLLAFFLTAGLVSAQVFPVLELTRHCVRQLDNVYKEGLFATLTLKYLLSFFQKEADFGFSLLLAPFALASSRFRKTAIALLSAFGLNLLVVVLKTNSIDVPILDAFRFPQRILYMNQFIVATLIGIGLSCFWDGAPLRLRDSETGRWSWFWPVVILHALAIAYLIGGGALAAVVRSHAFILLLTVSLIVAGGIVLYRSGLSLRAKRAVAGAGTLLLLAGIVFYGNAVSLPRNFLVLACSIILTGFLLANASMLPDWAKKLAVCVIVLFVLLDAGIVRYFPVPGTSKSAFPDTIAQHKGWIEENSGYSRVVAWKKYLHNSASPSGVFDLDNYEPLVLLRWRNFVRFVVGPAKFDETTNYFRPFYGKPSRYGLSFLRHKRLLGLCSLRYLIAGGGLDSGKMSDLGAHSWALVPEGSPAGSQTYIFENKLALPRAYLVSSYVTTGNEEESLAAIGDNISELPRSVVLENGAPSFPSATEPIIPGAARIVDYGINKVELRVESQEPSLLILTDSYYPGWVASVDGEKKPIWRANSLFRAVEVPTGSHRVVFRYRPASLYLGMAVSLATLLFIAAGLLVQAHRSRSADKKPRISAD